MATLELDTVTYEGLNAAETAKAIARNIEAGAVTYDIVTEHGPGGGWPIIRWTGDVKTLAYVAAKYVGMSRGDLAAFAGMLAGITE